MVMITLGAGVRYVDPDDVPKHHPNGRWLASMIAVAQFDERLREALQENAARANTGRALADSLKLQQTTQQRATVDAKKHGRRRKGQVIDLDSRTIRRPRRRRVLLGLLVLEAAVAFIAVAIFIAYLVSHGAQTG
jgi:hypothetical protein